MMMSFSIIRMSKIASPGSGSPVATAWLVSVREAVEVREGTQRIGVVLGLDCLLIDHFAAEDLKSERDEVVGIAGRSP
jgi:hypothetical protein